LTGGHSVSVTENTAESRSRASSPGTYDADQLRSTPSNVAPIPRDRAPGTLVAGVGHQLHPGHPQQRSRKHGRVRGEILEDGHQSGTL
jgi:hypothetical protein